MSALRPSVRPRGHFCGLHQLGALVVDKISFERDGALEGVAAAIPAMVVRHCYLEVGKRDLLPSRLQPVASSPCTRRAKRSATRRGSPRRGAAPAIGAADREHRCAGTAVERASAVKAAGHHSPWAGSAVVVRILHRAFLSDFDRPHGWPVRAGRGSASVYRHLCGASARIGAVSRSLMMIST
jgi:hypothetical protein